MSATARCSLLTRARWALDEDELKQLQDRAEFFGLENDESKVIEFENFRKKYLNILDSTNKRGILYIEIDDRKL